MSLFGSNTATQNQNQPAGGGLFGSSTTQNQGTGSSLFGNTGTQQQPNQGTSLFGNNTTTQNQPAAGGGLFGSNATNTQNQAGSSLFGANTATQNQQQGTSIFGANTATQNQPANTGTSLFGNTTTNTQPQQTTSLFGASTTNQQTQPAANTTSNTSLFNQPTQVPPLYQSTANFNQSTQPQQTHLSTLLQSGLGASTSHPPYGALGSASQHDLARSRLAEHGLNARPNEKSVFNQVQTLVRKWDPNSTDTLMQGYLYNAANTAYAPFYHRAPDEEESKWEEALAKKPEAVVDGDGGSVSFVPVLVRGFHALGQRVEYQGRIVNEMRTRLHEMNNSLDAVMRTHSQSLSVRLENSRRQHAALSQRCLRLAVKAQILRHRNYPLDSAEEGLRRTLLQLEKQVFDPQFQAREEEIWARMVALRERGRWLEEEGKRVRSEVEGQQQASDGQGAGAGISEELSTRTLKILKDYGAQISALGRELEVVRKEFGEWEGGRAGR